MQVELQSSNVKGNIVPRPDSCTGQAILISGFTAADGHQSILNGSADVVEILYKAACTSGTNPRPFLLPTVKQQLTHDPSIASLHCQPCQPRSISRERRALPSPTAGRRPLKSRNTWVDVTVASFAMSSSFLHWRRHPSFLATARRARTREL